MKTQFLLSVAMAGLLTGWGAMAQTHSVAPAVAPSAPSSVPHPSVGGAVVPATASSAPAPVPVSAVTGVAPVAIPVPPAAQAIQVPSQPSLSQDSPDLGGSMGDDDLTREVARLNKHRDVIQAQMDLDKTRASRNQALLQNQLDLLKLQSTITGFGKESSKAGAQAKGTAEGSESSASSAAPLSMVLPPPQVRSIYGFGDNVYAEIYVGSAKVLATRGTVLSGGEKVVDITPSSVVVLKNGRRQVLPVSGSAGIQPLPSTSPSPSSFQGAGVPLPPLNRP